jgi:SAM-dependent methyltransferase
MAAHEVQAPDADRPDREQEASEWAHREAAQAAAYDNIGDRYDEAFPHKDGQLRSGEWLLERLPPRAHVLDIGCGTGLPTLRQLVDGGCQVTGLDLSPTMCDLARRNVPEARIIQAALLDAPDAIASANSVVAGADSAVAGADSAVQDPERFDAVVAFFSLLHLPRARMSKALAMVRRMLKPGGWFALAMVEADVDDQVISFLGQQIRVTGYLRDDLRALLKSCGFVVEEEHALSYAPATTQAQPEIQLFVNCRNAD